MPRNARFAPSREPLRTHAALELDPAAVSGPLPFLNPTNAQYHPLPPSNGSAETSNGTTRDTGGAGEQRGSSRMQLDRVDGGTVPDGSHDNAADMQKPANANASAITYAYTTRNNRKGRHALRVTPPSATAPPAYQTPPPTATPRVVLRSILRMFTTFPFWDVSYDVAFIFTLGSMVWVINAFFVFLPLVRPSTEFDDEILTGGGVTAFVGATIFELGSVLLMLEAVNEERTGCFGWAVERVVDEYGARMRARPAPEACRHHHRNRRNLVGKGASGSSKDEAGRSWVWMPSWTSLRTHYFHELGFLACLSQLLGATVFWISGFTALPGILNKLSPGLEDGIYWTPQVVGGTGFIISGMLFMVETQGRWWKPAFGVLGWHIGFWNLVGGVGFTLCPCFGYDTHSWAQYQASLSTFWGSWAFLIGSVVQWYESLEKHPVEVDDLPQSTS